MLAAPAKVSSATAAMLHKPADTYHYDYNRLNDTTLRDDVQRRTTAIRQLVRQTAESLVTIGQYLIDVKDVLPHGEFGEWLSAEFNWSDSAANKMMNVARQFKSVNFTDLNVGTSALYLLAAPSTPQAARDEAIQLAETGETVTHAKAKEIVSQKFSSVYDLQYDVEVFLNALDEPVHVNAAVMTVQSNARGRNLRQRLMSHLEDNGTAFRERDLRQAINTVAERLQEIQRRQQPGPAVEEFQRAYDGYQYECENCGHAAKKARRVNGSLYCIECGDDSLIELEAAEDASAATPLASRVQIDRHIRSYLHSMYGGGDHTLSKKRKLLEGLSEERPSTLMHYRAIADLIGEHLSLDLYEAIIDALDGVQQLLHELAERNREREAETNHLIADLGVQVGDTLHRHYSSYGGLRCRSLVVDSIQSDGVHVLDGGVLTFIALSAIGEGGEWRMSANDSLTSFRSETESEIHEMRTEIERLTARLKAAQHILSLCDKASAE